MRHKAGEAPSSGGWGREGVRSEARAKQRLTPGGRAALPLTRKPIWRASGVLPSVADKPRYVAAMFGRIAPRYDFMNTLMTGGQDSRWRRIVVDHQKSFSR